MTASATDGLTPADPPTAVFEELSITGSDDAPVQSVAVDDEEHWVELRVHGVSGTPPESILRSAFVTQVAGDDRGRFFRPADSFGAERQNEPGRILEAYHWGRFTSGSWSQALWLLIIPFGLINTAGFTFSRSPAPGLAERISSAVAGAALRIVGLTASCLLVYSSAVVAMDLYGWQVQRAGQGDGRQWWLVGAAALPVAVVALFFVFGKTNKRGQEPGLDQHNDPLAKLTLKERVARRRSDGASGQGDGATPGSDAEGLRGTAALHSDLAKGGFFAGDPDAPALRLLHSAAPLHMTSALMLWPLAESGDAGGAFGRGLALGLLAVNALFVLLIGDPEKPGGHQLWHRLASAFAVLLAVVGVVLVIVSGLVVGFTDTATRALPAGGRPGNMPGIGGVAMTFLLVAVGALVILLVAGGVLAFVTRRPRPADGSPEAAFKRFAFGMTGWLLASIGAYLSVGFAAAFSFAAQGTINRLDPTTPVEITPILQRVAYAWGLTVVEIGLLAVAGVVLLFARRRRFGAVARTMFTHRAREPEALPEEWVRRVGTAMFLARLKNFVPAVFTVFAVTGMMLSLVAGSEQLAIDRPAAVAPLSSWLDTLVGWMSGLSDGGAGWLAWLGTWALTGLSVALIVLGRGAIRAETARRGINVVWDVVAFWPRKVHPFVPPPYSQQVVAGLRRRVSWHLGELQDPTARPPARPATRVVVAAHSQGSLITVAALLWLTPAEARRVGLVTFGSQLQQQFARAFPTAVDVDLLRALPDKLGSRWRNLYRDTDPIAGPVLSWRHRTVAEPGNQNARYLFEVPVTPDPPHGRSEFGPEWRLLDPIRHDAGLMAGPMYRIRGHSDYPDDPSWDDAVRAVLP